MSKIDIDMTWKEIFETLTTIAKTQSKGIRLKDAVVYKPTLKILKSSGFIFHNYDNYKLKYTSKKDCQKYKLRKNGKLIFDTIRFIEEDSENTYHNEVFHQDFEQAIEELTDKYLEGYQNIVHNTGENE